MKLCDLFLDEHTAGVDCADPAHREAIAHRSDRGDQWHKIVAGEDAGGRRDFLDGKPIHCGAGLELQAIEHREDDYGGYVVYLQTGVRARYEIDFARAGGRGYQYGRDVIVLYTRVAGHSFTTEHHQWMRFRWPPEKR